MTDFPPEYEIHAIPSEPGLVAAARAQPGGWVYDIDHPYPADQPTPPEAIRGGWEVDSHGLLTGRFARNARYRAIVSPDRTLKPYMHAAARTNRDQWIVEIDPRGEASFPDIPKELIRGWWYVDKDGRITRQFRPNSLWTPPA